MKTFTRTKAAFSFASKFVGWALPTIASDTLHAYTQNAYSSPTPAEINRTNNGCNSTRLVEGNSPNFSADKEEKQPKSVIIIRGRRLG